MNKSESIAELATALAAFQAEITNPKNTADNPFFKSKYAPLNDILTLVRPTLAKHGLSVLQSPSGDGDKIVITTLLMHSSGQWIETCPLVLKAEKITAQGAGSAITYGRRYALSAVLGISSEDDDDANHASKPEQKGANKPASAQAGDIPPEMASAMQIKRLFAAAKDHGVDLEIVKERIRTHYKKESTKDLKATEISGLIKWVESYHAS